VSVALSVDGDTLASPPPSTGAAMDDLFQVEIDPMSVSMQLLPRGTLT